MGRWATSSYRVHQNLAISFSQHSAHQALGERKPDKLPFLRTMSDTPSTTSSPASSHLYPARDPPQLYPLYSGPPPQSHHTSMLQSYRPAKLSVAEEESRKAIMQKSGVPTQASSALWEDLKP